MTFEEAYRQINGRYPSDELTKHALTVERIVQEANLDPILLMYLADSQAQAARERGLAEMRQTTKEAVEGLRNALPSAAEAQKSIGALAGVQTALNAVARLARQVLILGALIGVGIGALCGFGMYWTWQTAYAQGRADQGEATHQRVCDGVNGHIAAISAYLRKLGYPQGAYKLEQRYDHRCR
jgi:hypothetical protein